MNEEYQQDGLLGGKGFYIALMLCVSVIAVAAWLIVREPAQQVQAEVTPTQQVQVVVTATPSPLPVMETEQPVVSEPPVEEVVQPVTEEPVQSVSAETEPAATPTEYVWPVVGPAEPDYSMDKLVYNVTMGDWRTHDGIDITAEVGEMVRAAASGVVEDVYNDDLYGTTIVIAHGDGLYSYYAGMAQETAVQIGDWVLVGDNIGTVGATALCESAQPPHLHFAMSLNGMSVDPGDYLPA